MRCLESTFRGTELSPANLHLKVSVTESEVFLAERLWNHDVINAECTLAYIQQQHGGGVFRGGTDQGHRRRLCEAKEEGG